MASVKTAPLRASNWARNRKWFVDNNNDFHWFNVFMCLRPRLSVSIFPRVGCGCGKWLVTRICLI